MGGPERRRFRVNLTIFVGVNALLALTWIWCSIAGIALHGFVWPWLVVMVLWAIRVILEGRRAYGHHHVSRGDSEDRIQREVDRMSGRAS